MEATSPETDALTLSQGLLEQKACYEEMLRLAQEQRGLLIADDMDPLLALIQKKRRVLERLDAIAQRTASARARWGQTRASVAPDLGAEVDRRADDVAEVLGRLIAAEEEGTRMAGVLRDETLSRLKKEMESQKVREAYRPKGGDTHLLDRKDS